MKPLLPDVLAFSPERDKRLTMEIMAKFPLYSEEQVKKEIQRNYQSKIWTNDVYQVNVTELPDGMTWLSIKRRDKAPCKDWRDFQDIKNQLCGPEREGLELYPAESRRVDTANQYHVWVLPAGAKIPVGWNTRLTSSKSGESSRQRPL